MKRNCYKAVNKFTGTIEGWGKSKSLEDFCERWDMSQINVVEITEDELNELFEDIHRDEDECRQTIEQQ